MQTTAYNINQSLQLLERLITEKLHGIFGNEVAVPMTETGIRVDSDAFLLGHSIQHLNLTHSELTILFIALAPHISPNFFDNIVQGYMPHGGELLEMGGVKGTNYRGMLPTGETALFILAGNDLNKRLEIQQLLLHNSGLLKENILWLEAVKDGEPLMSGRLIINEEWLHKILFGKEASPKFSPGFPAKSLHTQMTWSDLVLNNYTLSQVYDIQTWLQHNATVMQDATLQRKVKPGYRVLFYGPSGTGKTLTATLLGKQFGKEVYRIDLSQVVSKYIGETEKNLEKIFIKAEHKDWILFFDEADALFGKRTTVQNSHDRYANQEISYLLQRVEDYPGLIILASNFKSNMDDAFLRRFQSIIHFPAPNAAERLHLWQKTTPSNYTLEPAISISELSEKYELTGAAILNVVHYAALKSVARNDTVLRHADIVEAVRKEFRKEDRSIL